MGPTAQNARLQGPWRNTSICTFRVQREQGSRGGNRGRRNKRLRLEIWQIKAIGDQKFCSSEWLSKKSRAAERGMWKEVERDVRNRRGLTSATENREEMAKAHQTSIKGETSTCTQTQSRNHRHTRCPPFVPVRMSVLQEALPNHPRLHWQFPSMLSPPSQPSSRGV